MKAQVKNIEVRETTAKTAAVLVTYQFIPRGGTKPVAATQEIRANKWEKNGFARLYLDGRDGKLGYWDIAREAWRPQDTRDAYLEEVIQAVAEAALEAMKAEESRQAAALERPPVRL